MTSLDYQAEQEATGTYQEFMAKQAAETKRIAAIRAEFDAERARWHSGEGYGVDMTIDPEKTGHSCHAGPVLVPTRSFNPHDYLERTSDRTVADRAEYARDSELQGGAR